MQLGRETELRNANEVYAHTCRWKRDERFRPIASCTGTMNQTSSSVQEGDFVRTQWQPNKIDPAAVAECAEAGRGSQGGFVHAR